MVEIKVENIVASTTFADKLDLNMIMRSVKGAEYEPEQFPGLIYKSSKPKTAMLLFRSGKGNCTGAKNIEDVRETVDIVSKKLRKIGVDVYKNPEIVVQNIIAVSDLGRELNLTEIAISLGLENVEYEPEQFPGMVYRVKEPKIVILIFTTGKVVCVGAKRKKDIEIAVEKLSQKILHHIKR